MARSRRRPLAIGAAVLGLGGAAAIGWLALSGSATEAKGASSSPAAITGFVAGFNLEDPLAMLSFIAPDEAQGVSDAISTTQDIGSSTGLFRTGPGGVDATIAIDNVTVDELGPNVARVSFDVSGTIALTGLAADLLGNGDGTLDRSGLSLIVIRQGGGWFISPLLSAGDLLTDELDLPGGDFSEVGKTRSQGSATTAESAIDDLLDGISDLDAEAVAGALSSGEERFVRVFEDAIDELAADATDELADNGANFRFDDLRTEPVAGGAIFSGVTLEIQDYNGTQTLEADDDCLRDGDGDGRVCVFEGLVPVSGGSDQLTVFTTNESGAVRVQLIKTAAAAFEQVLRRLDRDTLLQVTDSEVLAEPAATLTFGEAAEFELTGQPFAVYEVALPPGIEGNDLWAGEEDISDDLYAYDQLYAGDGTGWQYYYPGDDLPDGATTLRVVVIPDCSDWSSGALFARCGESGEGTFALGVGSTTPREIAFADGQTVELAPLETALVSFRVDDEIDAILDFAAASWYLTAGEYSYNDDGSVHLVPGEYTARLAAGYNDGSPVSVRLAIEEVEPAVGPEDISASSPSTTFALSGNEYVEFDAYADTGDSVVITVTPQDGQDVVLVVMSSSGSICGDVDSGYGGVSESCDFSVNSGGNFTVYVYGYSSSDSYGAVTVSIDIG
ncbi:MAG: hypothetical protein Q7V88_09235 [Actinomycetota bacterium]|nr:hypothetical protein [Actinomycetota bacterium]